MDKITFGSLKAESSIFNAFEKGGRAAQIGEVRDWSGKKMMKTARGWVPYTGGKSKSMEEALEESMQEFRSDGSWKSMSPEEINSKLEIVKLDGLKAHFKFPKFEANYEPKGYGFYLPNHGYLSLSGKGSDIFSMSKKSLCEDIMKMGGFVHFTGSDFYSFPDDPKSSKKDSLGDISELAKLVEKKKSEESSKKVTLAELPRIAREHGLRLERVTVRGFADGFFIFNGKQILGVVSKEGKSFKYKDDDGKVVEGGPEIIVDLIKKFGKKPSSEVGSPKTGGLNDIKLSTGKTVSALTLKNILFNKKTEGVLGRGLRSFSMKERGEILDHLIAEGYMDNNLNLTGKEKDIILEMMKRG